MIPDEVRFAIDELIEYATFGGEDDESFDDLTDWAKRVRHWLDALPQTPQPDWDAAPEWAMWWAVDADGDARWWKEEPTVSYGGSWSNFDWVTDKRYDIPIGIDWRTLKVRRPEVTE